MTTIINGSSPSITFSDSTTQSSGVNTTNPVFTGDASISGLTVGKGGAGGAANTAFGNTAIPIAPNSGVTAIGNHAGAAFNTNSDTGQSTFVGYYAGASCVTGTDNTFVGGSAGTNTTGSRNTAVGSQALQLNTTASNNTAVGYQAGYSNTTGNEIAAFGHSALKANTTGLYGTAFGFAALEANTTANANTAVGNSALRNNTTGASNTAMGESALVANTATSNCTAIGYQAGSALSGSAGGFTSIGYRAGNNFTNGFNSTFVGNGAQAGAPTGNNEIVICTSGQTGKGTSTGFIAPSTGGVYQGNNSSSWSTTSDRRLKKNIVDNTEGLDIISQIRVRNFEYRTTEEVTELPAHTVIEKTGVQLGVIAQELREVCPDCVKEESTGVISVDSDNIFWHMVNAIKDLKAELDTVKAELAALKG